MDHVHLTLRQIILRLLLLVLDLERMCEYFPGLVNFRETVYLALSMLGKYDSIQ
ncbi:hypothetical protein LPJ71_002484, partial [Coemansia sp. S17]